MKNPFAQPVMPLQLTMQAAPELLDVLELMLEEQVLTITRPVDSVTPQLIVIYEDASKHDVQQMIAQTAERLQMTPPVQHEMRLKDIDWVEQVQKDFPAFALARFFVHGSYHEGGIPANHFPLLIDAAAAFGTGEHATTSGCLQALCLLRKRMPHAPRILDMGCGTAILAVAAAHLWPRANVTAYDNDAGAVRVATHNVCANRKHNHIRCRVSDGYKGSAVQRDAPYEVIVANILARPLMRMAHAAVQCLAPHGVLILSGLLMHQVPMVASAYRAQGLYVQRVLPQGRWAVVVLQKNT